MKDRIGVFVTSSLIGAITFMPNGMMSASGNEGAVRASSYGVSASAAFVLAGVAGLVNAARTATGLVGLAVTLQIAAIATFRNYEKGR